MTPRDTPPTSLLREAIHAELRVARYKARHSIRKPSKWKAVAGAAGLIAAIAAVCGAAPWAGGGPSPTADQLRTPSNSSKFNSALTNMAKSAANDAATRNHGTVLGSGQAAATPAAAAPAHSASAPAPAAPVPAASARTAAAPAASAAAKPAKPAAVAAAAKPTTAKPASTNVAPSVQPGQKQAAQSAVPTLLYDSVEPAAIPSGHTIATYSDGPFAQSSAAVAGRGDVLWIDVNGSNTNANALDVEPGDATPAGAAAWVSAKLTKDPSSTAIIYTFRNDWAPVIDDVDALPTWMHSHVKYWIADPTGYAHILPGAAATQWYWGPTFDISTAEPGFFS